MSNWPTVTGGYDYLIFTINSHSKSLSRHILQSPCPNNNLMSSFTNKLVIHMKSNTLHYIYFEPSNQFFRKRSIWLWPPGIVRDSRLLHHSVSGNLAQEVDKGEIFLLRILYLNKNNQENASFNSRRSNLSSPEETQWQHWWQVHKMSPKLLSFTLISHYYQVSGYVVVHHFDRGFL